MLFLQFTRPAYLVSLLLLPCIYILVRKVGRSSSRSARVVLDLPTFLRLSVVGLLVISISGPQIPRKNPQRAVVFVLDHSDSISPRDKAAALAYLKHVASTMQPGDQAGLIVFGKDAVIERPIRATFSLSAVHSAPTATSSDIARALHLAIAMLAPHPHKEIVLISDGNQNAGDAVREAAIAASHGIPIAIVPLGTALEAGRDASVEEMTAPGQIRIGDPFEVKVVLHGTAQARVIVKLYHNGAHIAEREAAFTQSGKQTIRFAQHLATAGFHQYNSVLEGLDGTSIKPNEGGTAVYAYGRPKVLYVATSSGPTVLRDILARHDFEVDFASPAFLPTSAAALSPYDAVIFDNVPATQVTGKQMQTIAEHVETFGGGFIMMGGAQSFGPGGYAQTALEKILPVEMRVRSREERPPLSVVLLLDKSGSMATEQGSRAAIDVAKEAVSALLSVLEPDDAIGVIAFDKEARAVVELQPLANKASVQASLQSIQAGGGTAIYPALDLAYHWLRWVDPSKKHVLLLSDGQTEAADFPALMRRLAAARMVLSAVGIGADVDRAFLQDLAATGNGRAYFTDVMAEVPAIFAREASLIAGKWLIERHFTPYAMADHEIFAGIDVTKLPGMAGYVASTPKPHATMLLASDSHEPILAGWRFGLGRTLALTSDLSSSWAKDWLQWASFGALWTHMVRWTSRRLPSDRLHPRVTFAGDTAILGVDAFEGDGRFINFLDMRATIQAPGATQQEIRLAQTASGRYEGHFDVGKKGTYWLSVLASVGAGTSDHAVHFGLHVSTLPEYQTSRTNLTLLTELARITNGAIRTREDSPFRRGTLATAYIDVWPFSAAAALLLFVLEVAVRRGFRLPFHRRQADATFAASLTPDPPEPV